MNGNYMEGAHVVDQHGVVIKTFKTVEALGGAGAFTAPTAEYKDAKIAFRPGTTKGIGLLTRGHQQSDFSKPYNLPAQDAIFAYDRALAHELMHSVGVTEHGAGDGTINLGFIAPEDAANSLGRPYFAVNGNAAKPVELRDEAKHDLAAETYARYAAALSAFAKSMHSPLVGNPGGPGYPKMSEVDFVRLCAANVSTLFDRKGLVGAENGQHSGDQDCIMRYYFAVFYPMKKPGEGYYQIGAGDERFGLDLCASPEGTGVNAPGHYPQSRHGKAASGAGNCAGQICPNDLVPPRPSPY